MATSYYSTGTVTLTTGSAVVTGNGTGWQLALIAGGNVLVQATGNVLPIASVDSDSQITSELEWTGASGTYSYTIQRDTAYLQSLDANSQSLSYLLSELRAGTIFKYDQSGELAGRDLYDARPKNFGYLVTIGVSQPVFYVKASNTDGDWAGPFPYGTGPVGPQGPIGFLDFKGEYDTGASYVANDGVRFNGSSFVALQSTTGNAPPTLPTTENSYWSLLAAKGLDGTGIGDMLVATYDPQAIAADAFARGNHTGDIPDTVLIADGTKKGRFDVGAVTAGQSRVYAMPDRDLVINPAWEQIGYYELNAAAILNVTGLSAFRMLRVKGSLSISVAVPMYFRTSTDGGLTWDQAVASYSYQTLGGVGDFVGTSANSSTAALLTLNPSLYLSFTTEISSFNVARDAHFVSTVYNNQASVVSLELNGAQRTSNVPRNALQLLPGGPSTMSGSVIIEGVRV